MTSTAPDGAFAAEETFRVDDAKRASWRMLAGPVAIFPIVLFLLLWFMAGVVLGMAGLADVVRGVLSAVIALVVTAGIVALWLRQRTGHMAKVELAASPVGLRLHEGGITRTIAWQDMTASAGSCRCVASSARAAAARASRRAPRSARASTRPCRA